MLNINKKDVEGVYLLSVEESETIPEWIRANGTWWWLRSPGFNSSYAAEVSYDGSVHEIGSRVNNDSNAVRPALRISNLSKLEIGDLVEVFGLKAQYIGNDSVLLCEPIDYRRFDKKSNVYETSEIKSYLDGWFKDKKGEEDG